MSTQQLSQRVPVLGAYPQLFETYFAAIAPKTARESLTFAEAMWHRNGTYAAAMKRVAAHFVTRIELDGVEDRQKEDLERVLNNEIGLLAVMVRIAENFLCSANCFISVVQKIDRFLACETCSTQTAARMASSLTLSGGKLHWHCDKCNKTVSTDRPIDLRRTGNNVDGSLIKLWSPHEMHIRYNPVTERKQFLWEPPQDIRSAVAANDRMLLEDTPWEVLKAIAGQDQVLVFNEDQIFHMADIPTVGVRTAGWGVPRSVQFIEPTCRSLLASLFQSVMMLEYLLPFRYFCPSGAGSGTPQDPLFKLNVGSFNNQVLGMLNEFRRNPGGYYALPLPVDYKIAGGEALTSDASPHMNYATDEMLNAAGVPAELYKGSIQYQALPAALRVFEQLWGCFVDLLNKALNWIVQKLSENKTFHGNATARLQKSTLADSLETQQLLLQLMAGKQISGQTALGPLGINPSRELRLMLNEERTRMQETAKFDSEQRQQAIYDETLAAATSGAGRGAPPQGPSTPQDVQGQAQTIAQQMLSLPVEQRSSQMRQLKAQNPTLYSMVKMLVDDMRQQAQTQGGQQMLAQMQGQGPPTVPGATPGAM